MVLAEPKPPVLTVIDRAGRSRVVNGPVAVMMECLLEQADAINNAPNSWTAAMFGLIIAFVVRIDTAAKGVVTLNFGPTSGVTIGLSEPELGRSR